jgi:hypothetical protein
MEAAHIPWRPIGELLVAKGLITAEELEQALADQAATGTRLGEILVQSNLISSTELTEVLMEQVGSDVATQDGFGSGLWSELKRRSARPAAAPDATDEDRGRPHLEVVPDGVSNFADEASGTYFEELFDAMESGLVPTPDEAGVDAPVDIRTTTAEPVERDRRIAELETEIDGLRTAAAMHDDELAAERIAHAETRQLLQDADDRAEHDDPRSEVVAATEALEAERRAHALTRDRLSSAEDRIVELTASADEARKLTATTEELAERDGRIAELEAEIAAHDDTVRRLELAREALDEAGRGIEAATIERDDARAQTTAATEALEDERQAHSRTRDQVSAADATILELTATVEQQRIELEEHLSPPQLDERGPEDFLCFIAGTEGYRLVEQTDVVPVAGACWDLDETTYLVTRIGRSPLPSDERRCAYLLAAE